MEYNSALNSIHDVRDHYEEWLMSLPNVVSVGVGLASRNNMLTEDLCIIVMVVQKLGLTDLYEDEVIPRELEGIPIDVQEAGDVQAQ